MGESAEIFMHSIQIITIGGMAAAGIWGIYDTFFRW